MTDIGDFQKAWKEGKKKVTIIAKEKGKTKSVKVYRSGSSGGGGSSSPAPVILPKQTAVQEYAMFGTADVTGMSDADAMDVIKEAVPMRVEEQQQKTPYIESPSPTPAAQKEVFGTSSAFTNNSYEEIAKQQSIDTTKEAEIKAMQKAEVPDYYNPENPYSPTYQKTYLTPKKPTIDVTRDAEGRAIGVTIGGEYIAGKSQASPSGKYFSEESISDLQSESRSVQLSAFYQTRPFIEEAGREFKKTEKYNKYIEEFKTDSEKLRHQYLTKKGTVKGGWIPFYGESKAKEYEKKATELQRGFSVTTFPLMTGQSFDSAIKGYDTSKAIEGLGNVKATIPKYTPEQVADLKDYEVSWQTRPYFKSKLLSSGYYLEKQRFGEKQTISPKEIVEFEEGKASEQRLESFDIKEFQTKPFVNVATAFATAGVTSYLAGSLLLNVGSKAPKVAAGIKVLGLVAAGAYGVSEVAYAKKTADLYKVNATDQALARTLQQTTRVGGAFLGFRAASVGMKPKLIEGSDYYTVSKSGEKLKLTGVASYKTNYLKFEGLQTKSLLGKSLKYPTFSTTQVMTGTLKGTFKYPSGEGEVTRKLFVSGKKMMAKTEPSLLKFKATQEKLTPMESEISYQTYLRIGEGFKPTTQKTDVKGIMLKRIEYPSAIYEGTKTISDFVGKYKIVTGKKFVKTGDVAFKYELFKGSGLELGKSYDLIKPSPAESKIPFITRAKPIVKAVVLSPLSYTGAIMGQQSTLINQPISTTFSTQTYSLPSPSANLFQGMLPQTIFAPALVQDSTQRYKTRQIESQELKSITDQKMTQFYTSDLMTDKIFDTDLKLGLMQLPSQETVRILEPPAYKTTQIQDTATIQVPMLDIATTTIQSQIYETPTIPYLVTPTDITPQPPPPIIPPLLPLFGFAFRRDTGKSKKKKSKKPKAKYKPSLVGVELQIKTPKGYKKGLQSGFGVRGI